MATLTAATLARDSSVTFSPTAWTTAGGTKTFPQPRDDTFLIYVDMYATGAAHGIFTVAAGTTTSAWRRGIGALTVTLTSTGDTDYHRAVIGPLESSRFMQSTGNISVAITTSGSPTGVIGVVKMPYSFG